EAGCRLPAAAHEELLGRLEVLAALGGEAPAEMARGARQYEAARGGRQRAQQHERHRRQVGVQPEEDKHGPRRRPERGQQVDGEDRADDDEPVRHGLSRNGGYSSVTSTSAYATTRL